LTSVRKALEKKRIGNTKIQKYMSEIAGNALNYFGSTFQKFTHLIREW